MKMKEIFIIGGQKVYEEVLKKDLVDKIYLSRVKGKYVGDKYFPQINENIWNKKLIEEYKDFNVFLYEKK